MGILWIAFGVLMMGIAVAAISRRVLGTPVGWPRSILIGMLVGSIGASLLVNYVAETAGIVAGGRLTVGSGVAVLLVVSAWAWTFGLGMAALVVAEAILPTGSLPSPWRVFADRRARWRTAGTGNSSPALRNRFW